MVQTFIPYEFLTADDLNQAFSDCVSLSNSLPQQMSGNLNLPSLIASLSVQTAQLIVTGDALFSSASAVTLPIGTTIERPNLASFGMIRGNADSGLLECRLASGKWANVVTTDAVSTPVNPPLNLSAPAIGQATSNAIPLGWSAPIGGTPPYTYSVQFRLAGTSLWQTWVQQTTATNTTISGLLPAARYELQITAFNAAGQVTSPIVATNTLGFIPNGPANLTASLPTSTTMALSWVSLQQIAAYQVQYAAQGQSTWTSFDGPITTSNTTVTGLLPNTTYVFQVIAKVLGGSFESLVAQNSTTIAATVAPNAATGLVVSGLSSSGWTLSWQPPSAGSQPLSYQAQYQLSGTSTWTTYGTATTGLSVTFSNMNSASSYNLQVVTTNSRGSAISAIVSVTTLAVTPAVGAVAGSQNSGPGYPFVVAPFDCSVANGSALAITGISITDPDAIFQPGTLVLKATCSTGGLTMTDTAHNQINGSATNTIQYSSTFAGIQAALSSLVYTGKAVGNDSIALLVTDQLIRQGSVTIDVAVAQSAGGNPPSPPPGGGTSSSITATGQPTDISGLAASRIRTFLDGIGLSVRLEDVGYNGTYTQSAAASLENMINYLGGGQIKTLRQECGLNINPSFLSQVASNTGSRYVLTIGQRTTPSNYSAVALNMEIAAQTFPNMITAFEGVYGADVFGNLTAAAQFQNQLYSQAHQIGVAVWQMAPSVFSADTFGTPPADLVNATAYPPFSPNGPGTGSPAVDSNGYLFDAIQAAKTNVTGVIPVALSNFGWQSFPDGTISNGLGLVNESTQATYILETLFSAFKFGLKYYVISELLDVTGGLSIEDANQTFGLFNVFGTQKRASIAIHNMFGWLADLSASAISFSPGLLDYTVTGKPVLGINTGYRDVLFQRATGDYWIVMWNEQVLNTFGLNNSPINVPNSNVTLTFNRGTKSQVNVYDPISSSVTQLGPTSNTTISLPAHPIFVQVVF